MKGQFRTERHCPREEVPRHFTALIGDVVYSFAKAANQPERIAENGIIYFVFVEDGLRKARNNSEEEKL